MEVKKEESKGKSVQGFGSMVVAISAFIATGVFIAACVIANYMYYGEGAVVAIGLVLALTVILIGKFMGDVLGCMGEMAEDMRWTKNIIEAKAMQDGGIEVKEEEEGAASKEEFPKDDSPCFIDWLLNGAGKSEYVDAFKAEGVTDYKAFMKLTKEDFSKMGMPSDDADRFVRMQDKMKVSK